MFHVALLIQTGAYAAGLVTALLISLPVAGAALVQARRQRWTPASAFWAAMPAAVLIHGPVLDALFRLSLHGARMWSA